MPGDRNVEEWKSWRELEKTLNVRSFCSTRRDRAFALRRISNRMKGERDLLPGLFQNLLGEEVAYLGAVGKRIKVGRLQ